MTSQQITAAIEADNFPAEFTPDEIRIIRELRDIGQIRGAQRKFQEVLDKKFKKERTLL